MTATEFLRGYNVASGDLFRVDPRLRCRPCTCLPMLSISSTLQSFGLDLFPARRSLLLPSESIIFTYYTCFTGFHAFGQNHNDSEPEGGRGQDHDCGQPCRMHRCSGTQDAPRRCRSAGQCHERHGHANRRRKASTYEMLVGGRTADEIVQPTQMPYLSVLPSHINLVGAEVELVDMEHRERRLQMGLRIHQGPVSSSSSSIARRLSDS